MKFEYLLREYATSKMKGVMFNEEVSTEAVPSLPLSTSLMAFPRFERELVSSLAVANESFNSPPYDGEPLNPISAPESDI